MLRSSIVSLAGALACGLVPVAATAQSQAPELPDGAGKELVASVCTACHQTNQITRSSGYTADGWQELIGTMVDLSGNAEAQGEITRYLATHFPPNDQRAPKLMPGEAEIALQEWTVPTLGQRSRDPVEAADGAIWWAGQWGNLIGRIDPATGEMTEYPLPADAMPHTVTLDEAGNVWYTGNKNATIGMLDPDTGKITEYPMPDPAAKDPHTAVFDRNGILWFTLQQSNMIGRLDPASGEVELATMPTADSRPYGIKIDAEGTPWIACNGSNCLVEVDPQTMALSEVELPIPETTVRRLDIAEDGMIWYVNSSQGRLGRLDPQTGEIKEWPSPSGPDSHPYALAVVDGIVWYNESGKRP
ncbi:MAG: virginiamycin B lyase family protein, partial [Geminicoccaceae bacterium]